MRLPFNTLSYEQQQLFATALVQRMLPSYEYFSRCSGYGDYSVLLNQIDLMWQKILQLPIKVNVETQLDKLELQIPDISQFDLFAVYPAMDACSGLVCLLQSLNDENTRCAQEVSHLSIGSVNAFLSHCQDKGEERLGFQEDDAASLSDPLLEWEKETQQAIFNFVLSLANEPAKSRKNIISEFRATLIDTRVTSLGIEY